MRHLGQTLYLLGDRVIPGVKNRKQLIAFLSEQYGPGDVARVTVVTVKDRLRCTFASKVIIGADNE